MIRRLLSEALACFVAAALLPKPWFPPLPKPEPLRFWLPQKNGRTAEVRLLGDGLPRPIYAHVGACSKCGRTLAGVRGDHSLECIPVQTCIPCLYPCLLCPRPDPSLS